MKRGDEIRLREKPLFGIPILSTVRRSSDGDWTIHGKKIPWLHYRRNPRSGTAFIHYLRVGEYVLMFAHGTPDPNRDRTP